MKLLFEIDSSTVTTHSLRLLFLDSPVEIVYIIFDAQTVVGEIVSRFVPQRVAREIIELRAFKHNIRINFYEEV